ncbi:MAG TPA: tetratricopeptide repeat protein, partial [Polyangiaceae bacterium]
SGDREGAIAETVNLAALFLDRGDAGQAEPLLREVVTVEPGHAAAAAMLEQVRAGAAYGAGPGQDNTTNTKTAPGRPALDTYDPNEPLPSYDLEEVGADQALSKEHTTSTTTGPRLMLVDEPFSSEANPLPSFPLGEAPPVDETDIDIDDLDEVPAASRTTPEQDALEEALEEADFFAARGLYEDARAILADQLTKTPNHRLVHERLREVEESLAASGSSQTIERSMLARGSDRAPDDEVAASLGALDQELPPASVGGDVTSSMVHVDVDQVFMKFKAGVRAQVAEADSATHYDLGVAYKEMGLLGEAIAEFEAAARDPHRECMCFAMIGLIYLEQGDLERSSESYIKALAAQSKTVEQEMSLYYDLGTVYEMKSAKKEALYYFQKIARRDPGYRDIADRIAALSPGAEPAKPAQAARAVNDDDDFERAFDDLFEGKN